MKNNNLFSFKTLGLAFAAALICPAAFAQPLDLSNIPIFLDNTANANILFLVDDSGSMDWEIVTGDAANDGRFTSNQPDGTNVADAGAIKQRDDNHDGTADCTLEDGTFFGYMSGVEFESNAALYNDGLGDCNVADEQAWRFRNYDFNRLYYNPNQIYQPWAGVDENGNPFGDIDPTNAYNNPYFKNADTTETIDLTRHNVDLSEDGNGGYFGRLQSSRDGDNIPDGFRYYVWEDDDEDGFFDNGEETEVRVQDLPVTLQPGQTADITTVGTNLTVSYPNSQTNFANWFSYYRSRTLLAKNAYGRLINNARNVRMGLVTVNDNNQANTAIREMNVDANKQKLLRRLYGDFAPGGGTPLRSAMNDCGKYLSCTSDNIFKQDGNANDTCPQLSLANGGNCQQNFLITMTDGYYNGSLTTIGNTDGPNNGNTPWDGGTFADDVENTLGDIAMRYYEQDIATNLPNNIVPIPGVDEATHQHVVTYSINYGVNGTLDNTPENNGQAFAWPNPSPTSASAQKIDDLRHAAFNGRGLFLDSSDPSQLETALQDALKDIGDRTSSAAAVALNSGSLNIDTGVFQARFESRDWSGQLLFFPVSDGSGNTSGCTTEARGELCDERYDAGAVVSNQNWDLQRVILTQSDSANRQGIPFRWNSLSDAQKTLIKNNPSGSDFNNERGANIVNFLRGDRSNEFDAAFRTRSSVLGDIVNSDPFYVAGPTQNYDFDNYAAFRAANKNRTAMAYVGANDGMLHAFNAANGNEEFAYVPRAVLPDVNRLSLNSYNNNHRYFVDGPPAVGDAYLNSQWRTILVSGLRNGGQALFALDVTNPTSVTEANAANTVLWEFSDEDDPNLGYTYSQPAITRMANGKWAAIVSSGYNNTVADGNASTTGRGYLFIIYLEGPPVGSEWTLGRDYERIALPAASGNTTTPGGIATPAAVNIDDDIDAEYIYVGDLNGNMWRVDVSSSDKNNWGVSFNNAPLFVARDDSGATQEITVRPDVGAHPNGLANGLVVYFGTGQFLETVDNDPTDAQTQTFYAIWDENTAAVTPSISRSDLLTQSILQELSVNPNTGDGNDDNDNQPVACNGGSDCFRVTSNNDITYISQSDSGGHRGWYMDLILTNSANNRGERQVSTPTLRENRLLFTTLLPSDEVCDFGGESFLMILDPENGGRLNFSPFDVNNNDSVDDGDFVQIDGEKIFVSGRQSEVGIVPRPAILAVPGATEEFLFTSGSDGGKESIETESGGRIGRILWRQIQ